MRIKQRDRVKMRTSGGPLKLLTGELNPVLVQKKSNTQAASCQNVNSQTGFHIPPNRAQEQTKEAFNQKIEYYPDKNTSKVCRLVVTVQRKPAREARGFLYLSISNNSIIETSKKAKEVGYGTTGNNQRIKE